ncbi:PAS domain S-box-containing protein [Alicyclobacillus hesperidum]|uniref:PAS domain S-box-containing protein n=1 Tax=Alicyclobacillus hesperidum TaxID=89784 RepID=A0A1H2RBC4_9BACL|nr:sigma 54-interacting transcriptional regulator [Alicyclobacillus hesperidum]SDW16508.1 PAS domain S-box-containing protein [Alicyclobacillus hesperidum]
MGNLMQYVPGPYDVTEPVLNLIHDAITAINTEGVVTVWNAAAQALYGIPEEDILGHPIGDFFPAESIMLYNVMRTGESLHQVYHQPRADVHVFISAEPLYDTDGELIGAVAVEQDITHLVRMSEEQMRTAAQWADVSDEPYIGPSTQTVLQLLTHTPLLGQHAPVLLMGEPGTGKRTIAQAVLRHMQHDGPFIPIACDALPPALADVELFGFQGGLLSEESEGRSGRIEQAAGGMLYLANVQALPPPVQRALAKALRVGSFARVGSALRKAINCQVVASALPGTKLDPALELVLHRMDVLPLRNRKEEIAGFCQFFLARLAREMGRPIPSLSDEVLALLRAYDWPGNVAELEQTLRHAVTVCQGSTLTKEDLPMALSQGALAQLTGDTTPLAVVSRAAERTRIEEALKQSKGNKTIAARLLGISRGALYYKMKQYHLERE